MKTTKKNKTTSSVVVTPAAPASPGGCTIGLDLGGSQSLPLRAGCHRPVDSTENQSCASLGEHTRPACGFRRPAETSSHHPSPGPAYGLRGLAPAFVHRTTSESGVAATLCHRSPKSPSSCTTPSQKSEARQGGRPQGPRQKTSVIVPNRASTRQTPKNQSGMLDVFHFPARIPCLAFTRITGIVSVSC